MRLLLIIAAIFIAAQVFPIAADVDARRSGGRSAKSLKKSPRTARRSRPAVRAGSFGGNAYYANCAAARAAGAAPVMVGEPGYSRKLDRDGDGIGCE